MLNYLVTSKTRRNLLTLMWGRDVHGTPSDLAAQAGVSFASAHKELRAMTDAGLAHCQRVGNATIYSAHRDHPAAGALAELARSAGREAHSSAPDLSEHEVQVRAWLEELGAPLVHQNRTRKHMPSAEEVLVEALALCRTDAALTRVMPVCLWKCLPRLDLNRLIRLARASDEQHTLGFLLDMTAHLAGDHRLEAIARGLRDRRVKTMHRFFRGRTSRFLERLEEANTPELARRWHFTMNMGLDCFQSAFDTHVKRT